MRTAAGTEQAAFNYQIRATESPTGFGAINLPQTLFVNPATGVISGYPLFAGTYVVTLTASNVWGVGTTNLQLTISNAQVTGLAIANVMTNYSSPYLLNFQFALRDNSDPALGNAMVADPRLFSVTAFEDGVPVSPTETSVILQGVDQGVAAKVLKAYLVLDFSESIASLSNGDTNNNGISDAVDTEVSAAQEIVNQQPATAQFGVYEFHRDDAAPQQVQSLTTDKTLLNNAHCRHLDQLRPGFSRRLALLGRLGGGDSNAWGQTIVTRIMRSSFVPTATIRPARTLSKTSSTPPATSTFRCIASASAMTLTPPCSSPSPPKPKAVTTRRPT